ncbi:DedA family protein [Paracoccus sp. YLB-12]|uniref:DedA family protein n=1 Tax=Paracoccus maritimus TaxID=2933292 RepID=A0ABT2K6Y7_9RHOB|nr:DedA family protein [Paracoccus sp. YLB-12]MCT4332281.1 DedA family protein [Paracoccus sp. YLB-12]
MKAELLALLPQWGPWIVAVSAFLSCMMIPVPTSFLLLTAGALTGTGHMQLPELVIAAAVGGTLGDTTAFLLARRIEPRLRRIGRRTAQAMDRARGLLERRGTLAVFLSRWLVTPLGPPMNYVAGASGIALPRFVAASVAGETLWAVLHLLAGHVLGRQVHRTESAALKAVAIGAALAALFWLIRRAWHRRATSC